MQRRDGFRLFLVVQLLYTIVALIFSGHLPHPASPPTLSGFQIALGQVSGVVAIGGLVGTWLYRRWGRLLYSASILVGLLHLATTSTRIDTPVSAIIWPALSWLMTGITVTLIYASPLAAEFASPAA